VFHLEITPEQAAAFVAELQTLISAKISHANIAAPIAAGLEDGAAYLAQEYAVGDSLDVVLRDGGLLSIVDATPLVESLAAAIDHAASHGVHHGSLHPRDIILSADGARITGFGIADALARITTKIPARPAYSSPAAPSDIYSLAAIAFEAMTGKRVSPSNVEEFRIAHGGKLRGALATTLAALAPAFAPEKPIATVGKPPARRAPDAHAFAPDELIATAGKPLAPDAPLAPTAPAYAPDVLIATAGKPALDLRIDHPARLIAEPSRVLSAGDAVAGSRSSRRSIVAIFLVFAAVAALSVGLFLRSPTPVSNPNSKTGVEETTVDLPAIPPASATPEPKAPLPAPTPSRSASGAIARPQQTRGNLLIRSIPADADVLVNGAARGKTPLVARDLAFGSYTIRVARDGYISEVRTLDLTAQRPTASTTFNLRQPPASAPGGATAGRPASVDAMAGQSGAMTIQSRPTGARVFVNGRLIGSTPATIPDLPAGPATVRIEMDGYETWATRVRVGAGEQTRVAASLERR
jgi:serine/threonine protein kinase